MKKNAGSPNAPKAKSGSLLPLSLALFFVVMTAFWPAVHHGFINYDDPDYITANTHVQQGLTGESILWAFGRTSETPNWHPATWLSHLLDYQWFGLNAAGHHRTSIFLHAASVVLLFLLLNRLTGRKWRSLAVAALFGLHPLRVESVAWLAERKDVLSVFFFMLTLLAYAAYAQFKVQTSKFKAGESPPSLLHSPSSRYYLLALFFFALGLMSKPMLVTLPFVLLLLDYWPLGRLEKKTVWNLAAEKVPFFLLSIADCVITFNAQKSGRAINEGVPLSYHLAATVVSYARYLGKLFWPSSLAVHYPQPAHWPAATVLLAVVLLLGISLAVFRWRGRAWLAVGWFWFLGMLVPVIGLVGIGGLSIADRYAYLPSVGVIIMVVWGMAEGTKLWPRREIILGSALGVALLGCLALTRRQLGFWQDSGTLFQHAIEVTGDNDLACAKLADYYFHENRPDEAMALYRRAMQINPRLEEPELNLGVLLYRNGRKEDGIQQLQQALQILPDSAMIHGNLGLFLASQGRPDEAEPHLQTALKLKPDYPEAEVVLGDVCLKKGRTEEALAHYQKALKLRPHFPPAEHRLQSLHAA